MTNARIDADYKEPAGGFRPVQVTYVWEEGGLEKKDVHVATEPRGDLHHQVRDDAGDEEPDRGAGEVVLSKDSVIAKVVEVKDKDARSKDLDPESVSVVVQLVKDENLVKFLRKT